MKKFRRQIAQTLTRLLAGSAAAVCVMGLGGCGSVNGSTSSSIAQLRIVDATPSVGLDIYANSTAIAYNLGFGTTTSYVAATPGTYTLNADLAGTTTALTSTRATLTTGKQYTLLISNVAATLQSQVLLDQSTPSPSSQVDVRFLDEAMSAGAVDVYLVPTGATLATVVPVATGLTFGTNTGYLTVPVGTYTLYVESNGAVVSTTTVSLYTGAATQLASGSAHTFVLLDRQLVTTPAITVTTLDDYESATASQ